MSQLEEYKSNVIETGLSLLTTKPNNLNEVTLAKLQMKEFGLSIILLGLAEKAAERVNKLQKVVDKLEAELFDLHILDSLDEEQKVERYNMANEAINSSANYIKATINNINWNDLELRMQQIKQLDTSGESTDNGVNDDINPSDLKEIANRMLEKFS